MAQSEVFHIKAIADFSQPEKEAARIRTKLDREINSAFRNMEKSFGQPLGHITGRVDDFASSLEASNARVIAFGASAGIVYQVSKAFRELVRSTIQVEKSMADIQVVLNANVKQLENYRSGIFRIAKETGQSFTEVSKAATELARQGLSAEKTLVRLKDALVLSRLSGMDTLDSVEALTAAINGFGETVIDSTRLVNKFAEVDQKFAVSSQDLAEAFKRVGSTAVDAGVSIDELIALVTTAQQITARGGSVIGNSFKTIFTRVQRPQVLEDLENAGIKVRDFAGESLKAVDILRNLANGYDKLASSQKSFVSEAVGGVFQINVLKALLKDIDGEFSIFARALDSSANASDAAAKKNEMLNKTLDSLINKSVENLREFGVVIGELAISPAIVKTLNVINSVVEYLVRNKDEFAGVFETIGKFVSGPVFGLVAGSIIRLFVGFSKFALQAGAQIAGLTKRQEDVARIQNMISNILVSQPEMYRRILSGSMSVQQAERETLAILRQQVAERNKMTGIASSAASYAFSKGARPDTRKKTLNFPNFADPIRQAVDREVGSGIPRSAIRIAVDNRLKSPNNPQGLGVYNTIDEPLGISQGINRSRQMGIDPRTHGIPNFASSKKRIYNPQTGKFESLIVDDQSGRLTDPSTGKVVGNLYFQQPESVLDPSKSKGRDLYKERQSQIQRDQAREAARLAGEMALYSQGLRKDPLMLPAGSVGGLTRVKGKSRDRYAEYIAGKSTINLPESITQFNESQRIAEVAKKTAEDLAKANKDSIARMEKILSASQSQESLLTAPSSGPSSINPFGYTTATVINNPNKRASQSGGYIIGGSTPQTLISAGSEFIGPRMPIQVPEQKAGTRRFFDEFRRVLTDPKVARSEKQNMIDAVSRGIEKGGMVSVKGLSEKLGEDYAVSSYKSFLKEFENTSQQFNKDQREALKNLIYQQGFNAPTMPLRQAGGLSFRERRSTFSLGTDPLAINRALSMVPSDETDRQRLERINRRDQGYYAKSQRTGRLLPISQARYNRLQEAQRRRDRSLKTGSEFAPVTIPSATTRAKYGTAVPTIDELLSSEQYKKSPSVSSEAGKRLYSYLRSQYPVMGSDQMGPPVSSAAILSMMRQGNLIDVTGSNAFNYSTASQQKQSFAQRNLPTFSAMGRGAKQVGTYFRDLDPMHKMALLGTVGFAASSAQTGYETLVRGNTGLSETEKNNRMLLSGAAGSVLTGAMMGGALTAGTPLSMFGGAAIGGTVAGIFSVYKAIKEWDNVLPQLEKNLADSSSKLNQFSGTVQSLMSSMFEFENVKRIEDPIERKRAVRNYYQTVSKAMSDPSLSKGQKENIIRISRDLKTPVEQKMRSLEGVLRETQLKLEQKQSQDEFLKSFALYSQGKGDLAMSAFQNTPLGNTNVLGKISEMSPEQAAKSIDMLMEVTGKISERMSEYASKTTLFDTTVITPQDRTEILESFKMSLKEMGFDYKSQIYEDFVKLAKEDLSDTGKSVLEFSTELRSLIYLYSGSTETINDLIGKVEKTITNFRERDLGFMRENRNFNFGLAGSSFQTQQNISRANFNREFAVLSNQATPMLGTNREIASLRLAREADRLSSGYTKKNIFNTGIYSNIQSQRQNLRDSVFGMEMTPEQKAYEAQYSMMMETARKGVSSVPELSKEIENQLMAAEEAFKITGKEIYRQQIDNFKGLQASLQSTSQQIEAVNTALDQNNRLSEKQEQILRQRLMMPYAQGDFLRSQSATRNAERRALEGSDPKTEITSAMRAFREEMGYTVNDFYTDFENSARDAAQTFKSEFKSAFNDFRRGTVDAGEALRQMALNVLDRIATNASNMAIDSLLNAAFGGASRIFSNVQANRTGGMVRKRYADGGMVTGGSGVVDDVPALLTSGEMVINREAVRTYGADYFNKINQGRGARAKLENRFLYLDDKGNISSSPTQGEARVSAALSNIGATNELMRANTDRFSREQRFVAYVQQRRAYNEQRSQAMKRYEKGIRQQAIAAGVSAGIGIGGSAIGSYFDNRNFANNAINSYQFPSSSTSTSYGPALPPSQGVIGFKSSNSGSIVPNFGSSNRDNIPYSLTGGEAVLRKEAVSMYGQQFVKDLNNGQVKTMRFGSQQSGSDVYSDLRNLPSSIDRLSSAITNLENRSSNSQDMNPNGGINNEFTFNIEIKSDSGNVSVQSGNMEQNKTGSGASEQDMKKIGEAVKGVVEQSISANLRPGGQIYNAIRRR